MTTLDEEHPQLFSKRIGIWT